MLFKASSPIFWGLLIGGLIGFSPFVEAEPVVFKAGGEVDGEVLSINAEKIVIAVDRKSVESIGGLKLPDPLGVGAKAPQFEVTDLDGKTHTVPDKKNPVILLKFWASWCPYCRNDIPIVSEVAEKFSDENFKVVSISIDQNLDALNSFLQSTPLNYPVVATADEFEDQSEIVVDYQVQGVPSYALIGSDGKIVWTDNGSISITGFDLRSIIEEQLAD